MSSNQFLTTFRNVEIMGCKSTCNNKIIFFNSQNEKTKTDLKLTEEMMGAQKEIGTPVHLQFFL